MTCQDCAQSVTAALAPHANQIVSQTISIPEQTVTLISRLPVSTLLSALKSTGLKTIVRGYNPIDVQKDTASMSGSQETTPATGLSAAVCIFEAFPGSGEIRGWAQDTNAGLARIVWLGNDHLIIDISIQLALSPQVVAEYGGEIPSQWQLHVREFGDLSQGVVSCGDITADIGRLDATVARKTAEGSSVLNAAGIFDVVMPLWQIVGRSLTLVPLLTADVVAKRLHRELDPSQVAELQMQLGFAGVIARSAGAFENTKKVCSCSGKTLWEEASL
eukprot:jgi/Hompol1/5920/HPOL_000311-RA